MEEFGWSRFFEELSRVLDSCHFQTERGLASERYARYIIERLENGLRNLSLLTETLSIACEPENDLEIEEERVVSRYLVMAEELCMCVRSLLCYWDGYIDELDSASPAGYGYRAQVIQRVGIRGRPPFSVEKDQIQYLLSLGFSWIEMTNIIGVSRMTLYRRRRDFDMLRSRYSDINTEELTGIINKLRYEHPYCGETMIMGHLRAMDMVVTRERVRSVVRRVDPLNTALRWGGSTTVRRPYSVPGPNSLWHIDGHHKLVRWRFVTHCGIDGYSRLIVFMKCSTNNQASTVLKCFTEAIEKYGSPSRVRTDQGRENILVAQYQLEHRGLNRGSIITGSSVHNQRVERIWRDMHRCVTQLYYRLFYFLEEKGVLDPMNDIHLFALHHVFLRKINKSLAAFKDGWNMHGLRTEKKRSPLQLFTSGVLRLRNSGLEALDLFGAVDSTYGIDNEGDVSSATEVDPQGVEVPETKLRISEEDFEQLCVTVDLSRETNDYGISVYEETVSFLQNSCSSLR